MSKRLKEIREVLIEARKTPDYDIASPRAFDNLVVHVIAAIEEMERISKAVLHEVKPD